MLSKILQINQNFISSCIVILFAVFMLLTGDYVLVHVKDAVPIVFIVVSAVILIINLRSTVLFPNQYVAFFVMLLFFALYQGTSSLDFYAALLFLCIIQGQMVVEVRQGKAILNPFDIGFFAGFMVFFYTPFIVFLIPIWLYYLVLGKVEFKRFVLNIIGFIAFGIVLIEVLAVFDWWGVWHNMTNLLRLDIIQPSTTHLFLVPVLIVFLLATIDYFKNINRHNVDKKLMFFYFTTSWVVAFVYILLWGGPDKESWMVLVVPTSLYLTNYFTFYNHSVKKEVYLWIIIVSILLFKFNQYIQWPNLFHNITF